MSTDTTTIEPVETIAIDPFAELRAEAQSLRTNESVRKARSDSRAAIRLLVVEHHQNMIQCFADNTTGKLVSVIGVYDTLPGEVKDAVEPPFFDAESKRTDEEQLIGFIDTVLNSIGVSYTPWTIEPDKSDRDVAKNAFRTRYHIGQKVGIGSQGLKVELGRIAQALMG